MYFLYWLLVLVESIFLGSVTTEITLGKEDDIHKKDSAAQHSKTFVV
jgi:hypothetical protein